ncbi:hypothetical protein EV121DRAFT_273959, partial [Schizophyllum commune]
SDPASESYSILDVPILHSGEGVEKYDPTRFLRSEMVMKMYRIRHITPHAIANAGMLTVWLFSCDVTLSEIGDVTTINYLQYYESYLELILKGLNMRLPSIRGLIRAWDAAIFPMSDSSILKSGPQVKVANKQVSDALAGMDEEVPEPESDAEESGVHHDERRGRDPHGPSGNGQSTGREQLGDNGGNAA